MSDTKYLDYDGVIRLWGNITPLFNKLNDDSNVIYLSDGQIELQPNKYYILQNPTTQINISLAEPSSDNIVNHYFLEFKYTEGPVTLPANLKWVDGYAPLVKTDKIYQLSILNENAILIEWDNQ